MTARSLEEAVEESHAAMGATGSGDIEPFMALYSDADDITFGNPFEPFVRGKEAVREAAGRAASRYRDGQVVGFERVATHLGDRLACVAEVEHLQAKVGGSDSPASIALRATSVFREENGIWRLVHRHADPITTPQAAESVIGDE
jgi:ketosteroid isomerase-like protein